MEVIAYTIQQNDGGNHKRKDRPNGGMYVSEAETSLTVGSTDQTVVAMHETGQGFWQEGDVAGTLRAEGENRPSRPSNVVAMDVRNLTETDDVSIPLQAKPNGGYSLNFQPVVAFTQNTREEVRQIGGDGQVAGALGAEPRAHQQNYIAFQPRYFTRDNKTGGAPSDTVDITNAHKAGDSAPVLAFQSKASGTNSLNPSEITPGLDVGKGDGLSVVGAFGVRRLTPTECERLQGFPDGWTKYRKFLFEDTEIEQADSARYRQLGNAVAVPVVEWIAKRIAQFRPTPFGADAEQQQATGDDEPAPLKPGR